MNDRELFLEIANQSGLKKHKAELCVRQIKPSRRDNTVELIGDFAGIVSICVMFIIAIVIL